jgi:ribose transport system substrate-binding protein
MLCFLGFVRVANLRGLSPRFAGSTNAIVLLGMLTLIQLVSLPGCSKSSPSTSGSAARTTSAKAIRVGISFQELDNPYFVVMKEAAEEASRSIGAELHVTDARHDVSKQLSDIEDLVQKGIDILLINPTDSVGVETAVQSAKKAGVVVVAVDAQADGPIDSFVGSKNYDAGLQAGDALAKSLEGRGEVAILNGIPVVPILERVKGFREAIAKYPEIKIVDTQNGNQERSVAMSVTENMLQAHPDLRGLFSVNDGGALGALSAIQASGKDIALVSVDGQKEVVEEILKGGPFKATVAQFPRDQIRVALGIALAKYWGADVPKSLPIEVKLLTADTAKGFSW